MCVCYRSMCRNYFVRTTGFVVNVERKVRCYLLSVITKGGVKTVEMRQNMSW